MDGPERRTGGSKGLARRAVLLAAPMLLLPGAARALTPTPRSSEGPFYPADPPADDDSDLVRVDGAVRQAGGEILHLRGRVLDRNGRAVAGARVEIWQCDTNGVYLHPRDRGLGRRDAGFQGFGHARSDGDGGFAFRTIVPVPYPGRTPHIHSRIFHDGRELLTTQFYIAGHLQNVGDFLFRRLSVEQQERASMVLQPHPETAAERQAAVTIVLDL